MILQHIIIPMFEESFKQGQTDDLIGGPPNPEHDSPTNIICVFVNKIIDSDHPFRNSVSWISSVIRQKGESQGGCFKKTKHTKLSKKLTFLTPDTLAQVCVSGGKKCLFFGKFGVLCFLETPALRFALLPYYRRYRVPLRIYRVIRKYKRFEQICLNLNWHFCIKLSDISI